MKNVATKKIISLFLIFSFIIPNLFFIHTQRASAQWLTEDVANLAVNAGKWAWDKVTAYTKNYKTVIARIIARAILQTLTQDIVNWINSGFDGKPAFMTNPESFLGNISDRVIGDFIMSGPLNFLCDPFKLDIKLNLGLKYSGYNTDLTCTLTGILANIDGAYEDFVEGDFIGGGGWDSWMQMASNPQNTRQGSSMIAEGMLSMKLETAEQTTKEEASWGSGSLSLKECTETVYEVTQDETLGAPRKTEVSSRKYTGHPGYSTGVGTTVTDTQEKVTSCETTTPGSVISRNMQESNVSWISDSVIASEVGDSINAILSAFASQLVKLTMNKLKSGLLGENKNTYVDYMSEVNKQISDSQTALDEDRANVDAEVSETTGSTTGSTTVSTNPLITRKNNALSETNNLIDINNTHKGKYEEVKDVLTKAKTELTSNIVCLANNEARIIWIRENVLAPINNTNTSASTTPISIPQIDNRLSTISSNISSLEQIIPLVNSAISEEEVDTAMASYGLAKTNTDAIAPSADLKADTLKWLEEKTNSEAPCLINRTAWTN